MSTRQYSLPQPLSTKTTTIIRLGHQQPLVIPDAHELQSIKADLEVLLPLSENRMQDLKRDLNNLNIKNKNEEGMKPKDCLFTDIQ